MPNVITIDPVTREAVRGDFTVESFKKLHGIDFLSVQTAHIDGHDIDIWHDDDGRISGRWYCNATDLLHAVDVGGHVFAGAVMLAGSDARGRTIKCPDIVIPIRYGRITPL